MTHEEAWQMTLDNQGLVGSVIKSRFMSKLRKVEPILEYDDLYQEGFIGLYKGCLKFEANRGYKLSTYAYYWIFQHINRYIMMNGFRTVYAPIHVHNMLTKLLTKNGESLDINKLYENGEITKDQLEMLSALSQEYPLQMDGPIDEKDGDTLSNTLGEMNESLRYILNQIDFKKMIKIAKEKLTQRKAYILNKQFGFYDEPLSLNEIGQDISLSKERVRQIEKEAIDNMRAFFERNIILFNEGKLLLSK